MIKVSDEYIKSIAISDCYHCKEMFTEEDEMYQVGVRPDNGRANWLHWPDCYLNYRPEK